MQKQALIQNVQGTRTETKKTGTGHIRSQDKLLQSKG